MRSVHFFFKFQVCFSKRRSRRRGCRKKRKKSARGGRKHHFGRFEKIDEIGDNPEELEKVVEAALNRLGDLYKDKIRDKQTAQKHALELLASRACDLNGDGKINTKEEKTVKTRVDSALGDIYRKIDGAANSAESNINSVAETAAEFKREAIGNKGFLTNDLANASDPGVKKAYAEFTKAGDYFAKMRAEYGLGVDTPITEDNILDALDGLADGGNKIYKRARAKGEDCLLWLPV